MDRDQAIRQAAVWRVGNRTQVRGQDVIEEHESISKAKKFTRSIGRCSTLRKGEFGHGDEVYGFFRSPVVREHEEPVAVRLPSD